VALPGAGGTTAHFYQEKVSLRRVTAKKKGRVLSRTDHERSRQDGPRESGYEKKKKKAIYLSGEIKLKHTDSLSQDIARCILRPSEKKRGTWDSGAKKKAFLGRSNVMKDGGPDLTDREGRKRKKKTSKAPTSRKVRFLFTIAPSARGREATRY